MPTYEYICEACEHEFEKFQSITADPIKVCPDCGKKKVRRKIGTGAGILFKGGGFYETDYRSKSYNESAKKDADASKPTETKSDTKSSDSPTSAAKAESKPAKTESKPAKSKKK